MNKIIMSVELTQFEYNLLVLLANYTGHTKEEVIRALIKVASTYNTISEQDIKDAAEV